MKIKEILIVFFIILVCVVFLLLCGIMIYISVDKYYNESTKNVIPNIDYNNTVLKDGFLVDIDLLNESENITDYFVNGSIIFVGNSSFIETKKINQNVSQLMDIIEEFADTHEYNETANYTCVEYSIDLKILLDYYNYDVEIMEGFNVINDTFSLGHWWIRVYGDVFIMDIEPQTGYFTNFRGEFEYIYPARYVDKIVFFNDNLYK